MTTHNAPSQDLIDRAYDLLEHWTGFAHRDSAPHRLTQVLAKRAALLGFDSTHDYLDALTDRAPTEDEPQRLINLVTNGLTAFWRDDPQLSAFRSALRLLNSRRAPSSPVAIWCAGVSTGEEAYTLAIIADEEDIPVHILGTDINTDFLQRARLGIYESWSLRRLSDKRRNQYLTPLDHHRWQVNHRAFDHVRFAHHNLLSAPPPPPTPDPHWDLIICQNVLIYFSAETTAAVLEHFTQALSPSGFLLFGSTEQIYPERLSSSTPRLRPTRQGRGFLYRPATAPRKARDDELPPPPPISGLDEPTSDFSEQNTAQTLLEDATAHMAKGDIELAMACLEACLSYDPFHPEAHCMMGATLQALGASHSALTAFQKALFLEPDHWFAAYRSAAIYESLGQLDLASRGYHRTLQALDRQHDPLQTSPSLRSLLPPLQDLRELYRQNALQFPARVSPEPPPDNDFGTDEP